jgi:hypothetical protein
VIWCWSHAWSSPAHMEEDTHISAEQHRGDTKQRRHRPGAACDPFPRRGRRRRRSFRCRGAPRLLDSAALSRTPSNTWRTDEKHFFAGFRSQKKNGAGRERTHTITARMTSRRDAPLLVSATCKPAGLAVGTLGRALHRACVAPCALPYSGRPTPARSCSPSRMDRPHGARPGREGMRR